jgi:hypothetical protein
MPDEIDIEELSVIDGVDPLSILAEMASIVSVISDADLMNMNDKEACINDCMRIMAKCNTIIEKQIEEQYPIYFQPKKKKDVKNANTKISSENEQQGTK